MSQGRRTAVTNAFCEAWAGVLVATDIVARGVDFPNVTIVTEASVPMDKESLIHSLGRSARGGRSG